jgi:protein-L-isoaspartate(D-aspartate) O-methyltransferase
MAWRSSGADNKSLADNLRRNLGSRSDAAYQAFLRVDRGLFVPTESAGQSVNPDAYVDRPVRINGVHLSAPHMYAFVLEAMDLQRGHSVLNLGSGSGYFSTLCAAVVGPVCTRAPRTQPATPRHAHTAKPHAQR